MTRTIRGVHCAPPTASSSQREFGFDETGIRIGEPKRHLPSRRSGLLTDIAGHNRESGIDVGGNRKFADLLLEGTGFELPVRGCDEFGFRPFCVASDCCSRPPEAHPARPGKD